MATATITDAQAQARDNMQTQFERLRFLIGCTAEVQFAQLTQYEEMRRLYRLAGFGDVPPVTGVGARAMEEA